MPLEGCRRWAFLALWGGCVFAALPPVRLGGGRTGTGNAGGRRCLRRFCLHSGNGCGRAPCSAGYGYVAVRITQAGGGVCLSWRRLGMLRVALRGVGCVGRDGGDGISATGAMCTSLLGDAAGRYPMALAAWDGDGRRRRIGSGCCMHLPWPGLQDPSRWPSRQACGVPGAMGNAHGTSQARKPQWSAGGLRLLAACTPGAGVLEKPIPKGKTRPLAAPTWKSAGI